MTLSAKFIIPCLALLPCLPLEVMSQVSLSKADVSFLGGLHDDMTYMMTKRTSLVKVAWI